MIQLSLSHFRNELSSGALEALRMEFAEFHTFQIRGFLDSDLLAFVQQRVGTEDFKPRHHGVIATELAVDSKSNIGVQSLQLRMNDGKLGRFMEDVTGISPVKHFEGRVYRMAPGTDHYDSWHDDVFEGRRIGISINLSPVPFRGGTFSIKERKTDKIVRTMPNLGPGDAIFFRIDDALLHMVSKMEGTASKTAFAGWFHDVATISDYLREPHEVGAKTIPA